MISFVFGVIVAWTLTNYVEPHTYPAHTEKNKETSYIYYNPEPLPPGMIISFTDDNVIVGFSDIRRIVKSVRKILVMKLRHILRILD